MKKKYNKVIAVFTILSVCLTLFAGCGLKSETDNSTQQAVSTTVGSLSVEYDADDLNVSYDNAKTVTLADNATKSASSNVKADGNVVTITAGGDYLISGSLSDGQIIVNSVDNNIVHLIFDGVNISCSLSAPIKIEQAEKVLITVKEGTENTISDNRAVAQETTEEESEDTEDTIPTAAIYSKDDLTLNGTGSLTVSGGYKNGIQTKDELKLVSGNITVTAENDAIKGKDFVAVKDGNYKLNATSGDGVQSSNTNDSTVGFILIENGNVEITAGKDGIQAASDLNILNGNITITTSGNVATSSQNDMMGGGMRGKTFFEQEQTVTTEKSETDVAGDTVSSKGIKADGNMLISGGTITVNSTGHSIHSIGAMSITGGVFNINSSKGKGFSAHSNLTISGGEISITQSTEGIESKAVLTVDGGEIYITASDDGLNAGGDIGGVAQNSSSSSAHQIIINSGYLYIDAKGDGIDSNGVLTINGGTVIVNGPEDNGNSALDSDGEITVNGGTVVASGSSSMLEIPSTSSKQNCIIFGASLNADSIVCIKDADGKEVLTFSPSKTSASIIFSSAELQSGSTYTVYTGGSYNGGSEKNGIYTGGSYSGGTVAQALTLSSTVTSAGVNSSMGGGMDGNSRQGNMPDGNRQNGGFAPNGMR